MTSFGRGFAYGAALALWTTGPLMALVGIASGHYELVVMGALAFATGVWSLYSQEDV